jgi:alpha-aminoadipate/glutamate carrier protein LysW
MQLAAECVECGGSVPFEDEAVVGEIVICPDCGAELEILSLNPPQIDLAPTEMEDWGE